MGGKKARGRTDRAKRAAAAAHPPAVPSTAHEPPKSRSCNQQVDASSEAALALELELSGLDIRSC